MPEAADKQIGYPAWAGIDLICGAGGGDFHWLPRVGGDRPPQMVSRVPDDAVTPRGRG